MFKSSTRDVALALTVAALTIGGMWAATAVAEDEPVSFGTGGYARGIRSKEMMHIVDTNGDGMVSKAEWITFQEKVFAALDEHKRGSLSAAIFVNRRCARLVSFGTGGFATGLCSQETSRDIDTNADGRISKEEYLAYQEKIFHMMDTSRTHPGFIGDQEMFGTGGANR
jgi:hypothetical protein